MLDNANAALKKRVLCVDLDGTLIRTDLLLESVCLLAKQNPLLLLALPSWLSRGKAHMKRRIAEQVTIDPGLLPYHNEFLEFLKSENKKGRRLVLGTASDKIFADRVAGYLGIFEDVIASDGKVNVSGERKRSLLVDRYGKEGFCYAGNAPVDYPIWGAADEGIVVGHNQALIDRVSKEGKVKQVFADRRNTLGMTLKAMRPYQWVKNLLLFVPLIMAHSIGDVTALLQAGIAFTAFCLCSSSVYVLNDLLDLEADRQHRHKRFRPFASGDLSLGVGFALVPLLLTLSGALCFMLPGSFTATLLIYLALTMAYSFKLKQVVLLDIITLASLYTVRIIAGGYAAQVQVSEWLLAFSMFFFLSLACVKRFAELRVLREANGGRAPGRGYHADDLELVARFGAVSGYIAVLVLALYLNSTDVAVLYTHPRVLWLVCPLILYWISRVWLLAERGDLSEDPIVFALSDKVSYFVGVVAAVFLYLAV